MFGLATYNDLTRPSFSYFFELPGEIREQILGYLVVKPGGIIIGERGTWRRNIAHELSEPKGFPPPRSSRQARASSWAANDEHSLSSTSDEEHEGYETDEADEADEVAYAANPNKWPLNYFVVSSTFYREVSAVFFRENTFYLLATGRRGPAPELMRSFGFGGYVADMALATHEGNEWPSKGGRRRRRKRYPGEDRDDFPGPCEKMLGKSQYRDSRRRIRNVVVYVRALRGLLVEAFFDPLGDMILAGGLKHLEIRVWWFHARGPGMLASVPMQAMYRVLKDPDLESASLKVVAGSHEKLWCPFHAAYDNSTMSWSSCESGLGGRLKAGIGRMDCPPEGRRARWVEIDLDGLIGEHGEVEDALRILKIGD